MRCCKKKRVKVTNTQYAGMRTLSFLFYVLQSSSPPLRPSVFLRFFFVRVQALHFVLHFFLQDCKNLRSMKRDNMAEL